VQAGSKSWKAFFFGSSDSSNFITVDKPPAALWVMEISARIFGVNSWSILVPQALEGVATVGMVYLTVRRWFTAQAALLAGVVVALTPVAALMFRFNNPDALLALLLTASMYALVRGLEKAQTKWLVLAGTLVGFGFLTKMLQAFLIIPPWPSCTCWPRRPDGGEGCGRSWSWACQRWWPPAGGWPPSPSPRRPIGPTSGDHRTTASST
jgi:4-amino-4-deoxy-L-arabinose transferase-like glycosyltransferase